MIHPVSVSRLRELIVAGGHDPDSPAAREVLAGDRTFIDAHGREYELDPAASPSTDPETPEDPRQVVLDALDAQIHALARAPLPPGKRLIDLMAADVEREDRARVR